MWKYIYKIELDKAIANMFKGQQWISYLLKGKFSTRGNNKSGRNRRKGKIQAICEGGSAPARCNYGNWGFQVFLPRAVYVLADWSEINYGNPAVIFHHRVTHILWRTIKIDFETQLMNVPNNGIRRHGSRIWECQWTADDARTPIKLNDSAPLASIIKQYSNMWGS